MLSEVREEIIKADQKASFILATLGVGFAAIAGGLLARNWSTSDLHGLRVWTWWLAVSTAMLSVLASATAIWPRYSKKDASKGVTYWGHIATFDSLEKLNEALNVNTDENNYRTRHQLWKISLIVDRKYSFIRRSLSLAGVAISLFVITAWL